MAVRSSIPLCSHLLLSLLFPIARSLAYMVIWIAPIRSFSINISTHRNLLLRCACSMVDIEHASSIAASWEMHAVLSTSKVFNAGGKCFDSLFSSFSARGWEQKQGPKRQKTKLSFWRRPLGVMNHDAIGELDRETEQHHHRYLPFYGSRVFPWGVLLGALLRADRSFLRPFSGPGRRARK